MYLIKLFFDNELTSKFTVCDGNLSKTQQETITAIFVHNQIILKGHGQEIFAFVFLLILTILSPYFITHMFSNLPSNCTSGGRLLPARSGHLVLKPLGWPKKLKRFEDGWHTPGIQRAGACWCRGRDKFEIKVREYKVKFILCYSLGRWFFLTNFIVKHCSILH